MLTQAAFEISAIVRLHNLNAASVFNEPLKILSINREK